MCELNRICTINDDEDDDSNDDSEKETALTNTADYGQKFGGKCYICHQSGHKSHECPLKKKKMKEEATKEAGPVEGSKEHIMDAVSMDTRKRTVGKMIEISQIGPMGTRPPGREIWKLLKEQGITTKEKGNSC